MPRKLPFRLCLVAGAWLASLPLGLCGCSGAAKDNIPKLGKVKGTVTLDSKPMADIMVTFTPDGSRPSGGKTDANGNYTLMFNDTLEGAAVGHHNVRLMKVIAPGATMTPENNPQTAIPMKYFMNSQLTADVKEGDNVVNFDLTSN
jgi:hypothetical protein